MQELVFVESTHYGLEFDKIESNYKRFEELFDLHLKDSSRRDCLYAIKKDFDERLAICPASSHAHFHNAFDGGLVDHLIRVFEYANKFKKLYQHLEIELGDFDDESVFFVSMFHCIGKLGTRDNPYYTKCTNDWHIKNQGKIYEINSNVQYMTEFDRTMFLLNQYSVPISELEYLTIRLSGGAHDEMNKQYFNQYSKEGQLKSNVPYLFNMAKTSAIRYEYTRHAKCDDVPVTLSNYKLKKKISNNKLVGDEFRKAFGL